MFVIFIFSKHHCIYWGACKRLTFDPVHKWFITLSELQIKWVVILLGREHWLYENLTKVRFFSEGLIEFLDHWIIIRGSQSQVFYEIIAGKQQPWRPSEWSRRRRATTLQPVNIYKFSEHPYTLFIQNACGWLLRRQRNVESICSINCQIYTSRMSCCHTNTNKKKWKKSFS